MGGGVRYLYWWGVTPRVVLMGGVGISWGGGGVRYWWGVPGQALVGGGHLDRRFVSGGVRY